MEKKVIFSIVAIIIILVIVFLSQQAYLRGVGKTLVLDATIKAQTYLADGTSWAAGNVLPKITGGVQAKGDILKNNVTQAQQKVSDNIGQKISNYISGVTNAVVHPGTPQNCTATLPTSTK